MSTADGFNDLVTQVRRVVDAWVEVSTPWKLAAVEKGERPFMCISASGACHEVLKGEFGLEDVYPLPVDIEQFDPLAGTWEPVVIHPTEGSAVGSDAYVGHLALQIEHGDRHLLVDPDQGRIGELIDGEAIVLADGKQFRYRARPEHRDFVDSESWRKKGFAAHWLAARLKQ